jgi:hypothetical protein
MSAGMQAAIRYFPNSVKEIETRGNQDQEFLLLCEDLADAEAALAKWKKSTAPQRELRSFEYQALVDELVAEVAAVLAGSQRSTSTHRRSPA